MKGQKQVQFDEAQRVHEIMRLPHMRCVDRLAIDGGAHVGSWTVLLAEYFDEVIAFEPCEESFDKLVVNASAFLRTAEYPLITLHKKALMDKPCFVDVVCPRPKRQTLTARQVEYGTQIEGVTIDSLELTCCDLIKLDLEGAEPLAILGALNTITKFRPFLVIEFNDTLPERFETTAIQMIATLKDLGYEEVWRNDVDRGFSCKRP